MQRRPDDLWGSLDGPIRVADMELSHLRNAIAHCRRHRERLCANAFWRYPYPNFNGEMAQLYAEQDWERTTNRLLDNDLAAHAGFMALVREHTWRLIHTPRPQPHPLRLVCSDSF